MRAINIFKLPLNNDTKEYFQKCIISDDPDLDINIALDECLCENTQYAYVGLYENEHYICWPNDNIPLPNIIADIQTALLNAEYIDSNAQIPRLDNLDIEDYWK